MTAEIICVGTELLLGDILNTNAQFLSRELAELGISVLHQHVIGDNPARLRELVHLLENPDQWITRVGLEGFARVVEVVSLDDMDRAMARNRWKDYAARGFAIQRHDLVLKGM